MTDTELPEDLASAAAEAWQRLRDTTPLVQCITNYVAMDIQANVLLAAGASPAMIHAAEEIPSFTAIASALSINIGTLDLDWIKSMLLAAETAVKEDVPFVLDPVGVGATEFRTRTALALGAAKPTLIRANASEILALAKAAEVTEAEGHGRGVDAADSTAEALPAAKALAKKWKTAILVTGTVDYATDGTRTLAIDHGHELITKVTAAGCALSGLCAAMLSVEPDPVLAGAYTAAAYGLAIDLAAMEAEGPGSLRVALLDRLYDLAPTDLAARAQIKAV